MFGSLQTGYPGSGLVLDAGENPENSGGTSARNGTNWNGAVTVVGDGPADSPVSAARQVQRQGSKVLSSRLMSNSTPLKSFALSAEQNCAVVRLYSAWNTGLPAATYWL
jgi:hypothetical protein